MVPVFLFDRMVHSHETKTFSIRDFGTGGFGIVFLTALCYNYVNLGLSGQKGLIRVMQTKEREMTIQDEFVMDGI